MHRCLSACSRSRVQRTSQPWRYASLALGVLLVSGCSLPQNSEDSEGSTASADAGGDTGQASTEIRSWSMLKIVDRSAGDETLMPGVDVDAIVVFQDGHFVSAGCKGTPVLNGMEDPDMARESGHSDPAQATLHAVDGDHASGGFVSLATGVLTCELPVPIETGAIIEVWDVGSDGHETWLARLAPDAAGDFEDASGELSGSADFVAP